MRGAVLGCGSWGLACALPYFSGHCVQGQGMRVGVRQRGGWGHAILAPHHVTVAADGCCSLCFVGS